MYLMRPTFRMEEDPDARAPTLADARSWMVVIVVRDHSRNLTSQHESHLDERSATWAYTMIFYDQIDKRDPAYVLYTVP